MGGLDSILNKLEKIEQKNCRTVIFYENIYPAIALLKKLIAGRESAHILLFSNNTMRQLRMVSEYLNLDLSGNEIILVNRDGYGEGVSRVYSYDDTERLLDYIETLEGTLIIVCRSHLKIISEDHPRLIFDILERAGDRVRVYALTNFGSYTDIERSIISSLFDVAIVMKKQDEYFSFGEEIYEFHIVQSVIPEIQPGMEYFKVDIGMEMISR